MTIALTGATGFIAKHLIPDLRAQGYDLRTLGRRAVENLPFYAWSSDTEPPLEALTGAGAIVHLAGETVAQRWTAGAKKRIRASRVEGTHNLVSALAKAPQKPAVLVTASAVGIYGFRGEEILTETSSPGSGFLADLTAEWEAAAHAAESLGVRVVNLRFGVVLGRDGGAFPKMVKPFRFGLGGRLGSGKQWMPWIHVKDVVNLILFSLDNDGIHGPVNATAPNPITNAGFTRQLAAALHRPGFLVVPRFALKLVLGEMSEALLSSERVVPAVAEAAGFRFTYPDVASALDDLCRR
jgi:uncharacterized protein (TIGR01777 family)